MDPYELFFWGILPAALASFLALAAMVRPKTVPAIFLGGAYLTAFLWFLRFPKPLGVPVLWHAMLPAAVFATVGATIIELLPERWYFRLPVFIALAFFIATRTAPRAELVPEQHFWYILLPALVSIAWFAALRLPAHHYPSPLPLLILCLTAIAAGLLFILVGDEAKAGQPALILSVPLGALAVFTLLFPLRDAIPSALTTAIPILTSLFTLACFATSADEFAPARFSRYAFLFLAAAPLSILLSYVPAIRRRPVILAILAALLTLILLGTAFYVGQTTKPPAAQAM